MIHWDDPEGWDEGGRRGLRAGDTCTPVGTVLGVFLFVCFQFCIFNKASLMHIAGLCQTAQIVYITIIKRSHLNKIIIIVCALYTICVCVYIYLSILSHSDKMNVI